MLPATRRLVIAALASLLGLACAPEAAEPRQAAELRLDGGLGGLGGPGGRAARDAGAPADAPARRVVSLNPSFTAILLALDAGPLLVGVDEFSARQQPAVASLPRVGGLYNPSLEALVALEPDLVVLVPSAQQRDFRARLEELGVNVLALDPVGFEEVLASIEQLGERVGRGAEARARTARIARVAAAVRAATGALPRPRVVMVLQRDPLFLAGRGSFVDEMLAAAGAENLGAELGGPWPRASREWLLAAAPEVILDTSAEAEGDADYWARWPSLPAVRAGRVVALPQGVFTLPGPDLDRALLALARRLHGHALPRELAGALE